MFEAEIAELREATRLHREAMEREKDARVAQEIAEQEMLAAGAAVRDAEDALLARVTGSV